jgi:hypothetical protein
MAKVGDVFRINTAKGWAYFQYTMKNPLMGTLIRVLPGTFPEECSDLDQIIQEQTNFWIFFPS